MTKNYGFKKVKIKIIPPIYDEITGELIEPGHKLTWRWWYYFLKRNKKTCSYKFTDETFT